MATKKKQAKVKLKLIPLSLMNTFVQVFTGAKMFVQSNSIIIDNKEIADKLVGLGYDSFFFNTIPANLTSFKVDHLKINSYKYYLTKFIKDYFELQLVHIKENEYYIDTDNEAVFEVIKKGMIRLGFVIK